MGEQPRTNPTYLGEIPPPLFSRAIASTFRQEYITCPFIFKIPHSWSTNGTARASAGNAAGLCIRSAELRLSHEFPGLAQYGSH